MNAEFNKTMLQLKTALHHNPELVGKVETRISELEQESKSYLDQLLDTRHTLVEKDRVVENQKYQLTKWAEENEDLTEEVKALRIIAKKYLKAV